MSDQSLQGRELSPHYYRDNFHRLLDSVEAQYGDLLKDREQDFLRGFRDLGFDAQCLYVRLLSRVGPWFREQKLHYAEIGSIASALDELLDSGLALSASRLPVTDLGRLCTREELCRGLDFVGRTSKSELLAALDGSEEFEVSALVDGRVVTPLQTEIAALMSLLFFGNRRQGLTDFVLNDLGVARYYPYRLDRSRRLFPDRAALDEYLACAALSDAWHEARATDCEPALLVEHAKQIAAFEPCRAVSQRRWHRLCNTAARELERRGEPGHAMALYRVSGLHPARERLARLLERTGRGREALALCDLIDADPWCEEERDAARRIRPRLLRALEGVCAPRRRDEFDTRTLELPRGELGVEILAARTLATGWHQVHYVENTLMNALFGLAFWEQIFAPVPGAFNNPYQSVPADMYEQGFSRRRADLLEARLARLRALDLARELPQAWRRYQGYQCRWVNWRALDESLIVAASAAIPGAHLLAIWQRMLFDPGENRRGFPDLLALGSQAGDYCMIEVKGPGDNLQESQKRWLRFFAEHGIPARVARVSWADD